MTRLSEAGLARQALRQATAADHGRVDDLFGHFRLDDADSYGAFLRAHARALAPLEALANPDASRLSLLADDLATMGLALPEASPAPVAVPSEAFRWGVRYALEGSRLGGAYLARKVAPGLPHAYLSAAHEKGGWAAFQADLDEAARDGGTDWIDQATDGARHAFATFASAARDEADDHG
ncbi:MAG: biliverdin-producing heme oxygenase [Sphingobium sp.]